MLFVEIPKGCKCDDASKQQYKSERSILIPRILHGFPQGVGEEGGLGEFLLLSEMQETRDAVPPEIDRAGQCVTAMMAEAARVSIVARA